MSDHHIRTGSPGPSPADDQARLLDWELVLPTAIDAEAAGRSVGAAGYSVTAEGPSWTTIDPWGTRVRIAPAR